MKDYQIVTVSNRRPHEWYYLYDHFLKSLGDEAKDVLVLNEELMGQRFNGLGTKPKWLQRAIKEKIITAPTIIFCDCWDLVFATTPEEVISTYDLCFDAPFVISAEKNCFPEDCKAGYDALKIPTEYKYLNSGFIVGETEAVLTVLESMDLPNQPEDHRLPDGTNFHLNDQLLFQEAFLKQPIKMELDYGQILSQTLHSAKIEDFDFEHGRITNIETGYEPCTFHFNGGAKDNLSIRNPILKHLNLL